MRYSLESIHGMSSTLEQLLGRSGTWSWAPHCYSGQVQKTKGFNRVFLSLPRKHGDVDLASEAAAWFGEVLHSQLERAIAGCSDQAGSVYEGGSQRGKRCSGASYCHLGATCQWVRISKYAECGAEGQNRTVDTSLFRAVLCQLSYLGTVGMTTTGRILPRSCIGLPHLFAAQRS
jgi:hypothetical protein